MRPSLQICPQRQSIIDEIRKIIDEMLDINNRELEAVVNGDLTTSENTLERLKQLRANKVLLMERYSQHVAGHGCCKPAGLGAL
jgi:hypothetical protein